MTTNNANGSQPHGPLSGIRVIDWTMWQFGPVSTMMLADLGADVIKVESLDGDHGRQFGRVGGVVSNMPEGTNAYFEGMNRNKRGIALDLKNPKGREVMHRLVKKSDVFVENFRKGVAERLGVGYDDLAKVNPRIIYGSASGYGPEGPDSAKPAFALTGEARSGALWWSGSNDNAPYAIGIADQAAGMMLSYGILGALVARERFGHGQKVDVSHLGSMIWTRGMQNGAARSGVPTAGLARGRQRPLELLRMRRWRVDSLLNEPGRPLLARHVPRYGQAGVDGRRALQLAGR